MRPSENSTSTCCPYFALFRAGGREHCYELCEATGEEPFFPSQNELTELCRRDFNRCPRFRAARARDSFAAVTEHKRVAG